jgi:hypothetical protein
VQLSNAAQFDADEQKKHAQPFTFPRNHQHSAPDRELPQQQPHRQPFVHASDPASNNQHYQAKANNDKPTQYKHSTS